MNGKIYAAIVVLFSILLIVIVAFTIFQLMPAKTLGLLTFNEDCCRIETPIVKAGEEVIYTVSAYKKYNLEVTVSRHLIDGYVFSYAPFTVSNTEGLIERTIRVPVGEFTPPGIYRVKTIYTYELFLRHINYVHWTEEFEVIK